MLFRVWFGLLYPVVALLSIDIFDIKGVPYEISFVFWRHLRGCRQDVLGAERIDHSFAHKFGHSRPRPFDIIYEQRIGGLIDSLCSLRDRLNIGGERKVSLPCVLGDEMLGLGACDVVSEEGGLSKVGFIDLEILLVQMGVAILMVERYIVSSRPRKGWAKGSVIATVGERAKMFYNKSQDRHMGVCESICLPASDSGQLQLVFFEDPTVGQLLGLSKQQKEEYWLKIKEAKFYEGVQNRLFPIPSRKDIGLVYFPNKYLYEGALTEEMPEGAGRLKLFSERLTVEGTFRNGKADGQCAFVFSNKKVVIKGNWSKGVPTKLEIVSQKKRYTIQFQGEKLDQAMVTFANMSQYRGSLRYDPIEKTHIIEGKGMLTYANGDTLAGNFVNGYLQGEGEFKWGSSRYSYRGNFKRGLFNGTGECDLADKGLLRIAWKDNKPSGSGTLTFNGIDCPVYYENGVRLQKLSTLSE